jgi:hypothetical protein
VTGASRFLIGLFTSFATHDGIQPSRAPRRAGTALGGMSTSSVTRLMKVTSDEQPTAKHTSVTLRSPRRSSASALDGSRHQIVVRRLGVREGLGQVPA